MSSIVITTCIVMFLPAQLIAQSPGDISRGKTIFEGNGECLSCHRVSGNGARTGPDLSDIGVPRAAAGVGPGAGGTAAGNPKNLELAILDPDAEIAIANRPVRLVTKDGRNLTGRLLNHENFTAQFIDNHG